MPQPATPAAIRQIVKRDGTVVPYDRGRIAKAIFKATVSVGKPDQPVADEMARKVEEALIQTYGPNTLPSVEDIQDVVENTLMENRLRRVARNYIIYRHQRAEARAARTGVFELTDRIPYRKIYDVLVWNMDHDCASVQSLNNLIAGGGFPGLVAAADQRLDSEIQRAAAIILERLDQVRVVIIAGPSSSGKTTTTLKLSGFLGRDGVALKALNIDHYFYDLEKHPRDEFGDYDYETPQALDLPLIDRHVARLLAGRAVRTPLYDFKSGRRRLNAAEMTLGRREILLIDSLHGLYGPMTASVPDEAKFRLYVETLGQMRTLDRKFVRWSDNRLLRRMIRDKDYRNLQPMETLTHWHYVRRSELQHIIPHIGSADFVVNTALPYELPVLKDRLGPDLASAFAAHRDDPTHLDAHIRAKRVHELLETVSAVSDHSCVPPDSLLREFIGGSRYRY